MTERPVQPNELQAAIEARRELGSEHEPHLVESFVERIERRLMERPQPQAPARQDHADKSLAIVSLVMAIPVTAIAATHGGIAAMAVVWLGIVLVNVAYARRR
jgi:hypothetical protein